jgi:hypothetical protein
MVEQNSSHHGGQETDRRGIQEGARTRYSPNDVPLVTYFLQLCPPPAFYHLPIMLSYYEFIKGLIYLLGQSPHDLIIFGNTFIDTPRGGYYLSPRPFSIQPS